MVGDRSRAIVDPSCGDDASNNNGRDPSIAVDKSHGRSSRDDGTTEVDKERIDSFGRAVSGAPSPKKPVTMEVQSLVLASSIQRCTKEKIVLKKIVQRSV